jgi:hypothetical protein
VLDGLAGGARELCGEARAADVRGGRSRPPPRQQAGGVGYAQAAIESAGQVISELLAGQAGHAAEAAAAAAAVERNLRAELEELRRRQAEAEGLGAQIPGAEERAAELAMQVAAKEQELASLMEAIAAWKQREAAAAAGGGGGEGEGVGGAMNAEKQVELANAAAQYAGDLLIQLARHVAAACDASQAAGEEEEEEEEMGEVDDSSEAAAHLRAQLGALADEAKRALLAVECAKQLVVSRGAHQLS